MPHFIKCPNCKEITKVVTVKSEPIRSKHYIDYKITFRCTVCGTEWTLGG